MEVADCQSFQERNVLEWLAELPSPASQLSEYEYRGRRYRKALAKVSEKMGPRKGSDRSRKTPEHKRARLEYDIDPTPRSRLEPTTPSVPPPWSNFITSTSTKSDRSTSPTKRFRDTEFSNLPIDRSGLIASELPQEAYALYQDFVVIAECREILPPTAQRYLKDREVLGAHNFRPNEDELVKGSLGPEAFLECVCEIWESAKECHEENSPEAAWNSEVHSRLLKLALRGNWRVRGIWYRDITSARVTDKSLLPFSNICPVRSKLVDYGMFLETDQGLKSRIIEKLSQYDDHPLSINASSADWIRFYPLAVSIETKRGGSVDADFQLGTWATAQLLKLQRLVGSENQRATWNNMPVLPLVCVTGHSWRLLFARTVDGPRLRVLDGLGFGTTMTVKGIYGIVAGIRALASWAERHYRPWFEKEVLRCSTDVNESTSIEG